MSRVGETLKSARLKAGVTQKNLAKKLGVSEKFINEVEIGKRIVQESYIEKASKILKVDLKEINMVVTDEALEKEEKENKFQDKKKVVKTLGETSELWTDAFSSVLKNVSIYDYSLKSKLGYRELPIHSNKVEGYPVDKVLYIKIQDNDMLGFRMMEGDIAFAHLVKEVTNNGIYLLENKGERVIRQIKVLGNSKILLVSNNGNMLTETTELNNISVIAKLERIEINLY
ncbi:MAG: LexA family transcriptional regulator [Clostridiales bacterium]|nr:LexA family transcriptional regulator [Clostridiales bacterium]